MRRIDWNNTIQIDPEFRKEHGVVFACPFKERGGATVRDYSGNRLDGTLVNGPSRSLDKWGGPAIRCDRASSQHSTAPLPLSGAPLTVALWFRPDNAVNVNNEIVFSFGNDYLGFAWSYASQTTYSQSFYCSGGGLYPRTLFSPAQNLPANTNYFWVGTVSGSTFSAYSQGEFVSSNTGVSGSPGTSLLFGTGQSVYFSGNISHPIIANKAWTAEQVARLYRDPCSQYWQPSTTTYFLPQTPSPTASRLLNLRRRCYA